MGEHFVWDFDGIAGLSLHFVEELLEPMKLAGVRSDEIVVKYDEDADTREIIEEYLEEYLK